MNPVTGNDILGYQGNVGLGLGNDVGAYGDTDAKLLNESFFNLAYQNMQKNKTVYEQKIKDRDETLKLISSGQLQLDQVLPEDRQKLMDKRDAIKNIFLEHNGDVKSNPDTYLKLQTALSEFNEANVYAKHRFVEVSKQEADASSEKDPDIQKKKFEHIANQKSQDLYKEVMPYQQTLDYTPEDIFKELPVAKGATTVDGDYEVTPFQTDIEGSRNIFLNDYNFNRDKPQGRKMELFKEQWLGNKVDPLDKPRDAGVVSQDLDRVNAKLEQIKNTLPADDPRRELLSPIQIVTDENGIRSTNQTTPDLIWKLNLATKYANGVDRKLNEDLSKIGLNREKINTEKADQGLKNSQGKAAIMNAKANLIEADTKKQKAAAEIKKIKNEDARNEAIGSFINNQAIQMFDTDRYTNKENIVKKLSPVEMEFITKTVKKTVAGKNIVTPTSIESVVYDYTDPTNPIMTVTAKPTGKDKVGETYTIKPSDVKIGVADHFKYTQKGLDEAEVEWKKRSNTTDFNGSAIKVFNDEKVKSGTGSNKVAKISDKKDVQDAYEMAISEGLTDAQARAFAKKFDK